QNHKGYKLYHQDNKIVFTSRDVLFNEDVFPLANAIPTSYLPTAIPDPTPSHVPPMNSHAPTPSPTTAVNPPIVPSISAPTPPSPALRRSHRHITQPHWLQDYIYNHSTSSPHHCDVHSFSSAHLSFLAKVEAIHEPFSETNQHVHWQEAMVKELEALEKNGTWDLIELLAGKKAIGSRWVYKVKLKQRRLYERYKASLSPRVTPKLRVWIISTVSPQWQK
ncbi:UNVERIFIED_CONTAM: hypothetical protein Sradi_2518200, partial [Sesamum radiatum]